MFKLIKYLIAIFFFVLFIQNSDAQFWKKRNKSTSKREIRKRQEEANKKSEYNKFNELIPMGSPLSVARNDYIWTYETANTVSPYGGDISIIGPSRYSFNKGNEIGTSLASIPIIPMVYYKHVWRQENFVVSSRHEFYSFTPALNVLRSIEKHNIIPLESQVPHSIAMKNELIVSKPFLKTLKCGGVKQPYLILTGAFAYDYAYAFKETDIEVVEYKFLRNRSGVILGNGSFASLRLQGDLYLRRGIYLTAAVRGIFVNNNIGNVVEQNSSLKMFLSPKFSTTIGYWMNFGKGEGTFIVPVLDLTYHFGMKETREKGLFNRGR